GDLVPPRERGKYQGMMAGVMALAMIASVWDHRSPLEWDLKDPEPAGKGIVALLSDWFPKTTGEIIHVDGGLHAIGA
ncbi:SDR family oxidoreductase, partial [Streptomyces sp. NPDC005921]